MVTFRADEINEAAQHISAVSQNLQVLADAERGDADILRMLASVLDREVDFLETKGTPE